MEEPGPLGDSSAIGDVDSSAIGDVAIEERDVAVDDIEAPPDVPDNSAIGDVAVRDVPEVDSSDVPENKKPTPKKRGQPKQEKSQCPICLRWYCGKRVQPGGHVCHPIKLPLGTGKSPEPKSPEPRTPEPPPPAPPEEVLITHSDVARFMARERMNRHERKRDRWHQQMFG